MAIQYMGPGQWSWPDANINIPIPDFNITETLFGTGAYSGNTGSNSLDGFNTNGTSGSVYGPTAPTTNTQPTNYTQPTTSVQSTGDGDIPTQEQPDEPSLEDLLSDVHEQYAPVLSDIDNRIGELPGQEADWMGTLGTNVTAQQGLVQNALEQGQTQLGQNEVEAHGSEKATLKTLANDVRNLLNAGNMKLGSMGASDSSATEMLKYALAKQGNQRTSDVVGKTRKIIADIRNIGVQLQQQAQERLLKIDQWKSEQEMGIKQYIDGIRNQLLDAKGNVRMDLSQQTVEQLVAEYQYAKQRRDAIEDQYTSIKQQLAVDYTTRQRDIEDYTKKLLLENKYSGGYDTSYNQIQGLGQSAGQTQLQSPAPIGYGNEAEEEPSIFNS